MKNIIHFSYGDKNGAFSAAFRLHENFQKRGYRSLFFCKNKLTDNTSVVSIKSNFKNLYFRILNKVDYKLRLFKKKYYFFEKNRNLIENISQIEKYITFDVDVIFLHWISGFIDLEVIRQLKKKYNCKVYWYFMDLAPMTGGCHNTWNCLGFTKKCHKCPAVTFVYKNLPYNNLNYKRKQIDDIKLEPLSCSNWITKQIGKSNLFKKKKIHEIMLGVNQDIFRPLDENELLKLKLRYNLPVNKKIIFFGSHNLQEYRKGYTYLLDALKLISKDDKIDNNTIFILTAGKTITKNIFKDINFDHKHIGFLNEDDKLAQAYQMADVFICPSVQDAGPLMINESIICGTPVVSFKMGVAENLIFNGQTGYIAELGNSNDLAKGIVNVISLDHKKYKKMKNNCRKIGLMKCSTKVQMKRLISLLQ